MTELKVQLETVTPLFLAGADPRGQPELRAASVRGALRFWLRALLGGVLGDNNLQALRRADSAVFGSTDMGASAVVVRLQHGSLTQVPFSRLAAWNNTTRNYDKAGIAYLFFAARKVGAESERKAIAADTGFELVLSTRAGAAGGEDAGRKAYAALWLLTHLGGLGARSRRGGGSLQVAKVTGVPSDMPSPIITANTPAVLQSELKEGLTRLREIVSANIAANISDPSAFDVLHPAVCKAWVVDKSFDSWMDPLDSVGRVMQQFRNRRSPDYENVKAAVQGRALSQPVQRAAFGLPIVFYYRSLGGQRGTLEGEHHDRRASPLMLHVTKLANGKYSLVLILFHAELLPDEEQLKLRRSGPPALTNPPDLNLIEDLLNDVESKIAPRLEVIGW